MVNAHCLVPMRSCLLVFNQKSNHALKLDKERLGNCDAGLLRVIDRCVAEFSFGGGMEPVTHATRARTRASASSPETMAT